MANGLCIFHTVVHAVNTLNLHNSHVGSAFSLRTKVFFVDLRSDDQMFRLAFK